MLILTIRSTFSYPGSPYLDPFLPDTLFDVLSCSQIVSAIDELSYSQMRSTSGHHFSEIQRSRTTTLVYFPEIAVLKASIFSRKCRLRMWRLQLHVASTSTAAVSCHRWVFRLMFTPNWLTDHQLSQCCKSSLSVLCLVACRRIMCCRARCRSALYGTCRRPRTHPCHSTNAG